MTARLSTFTFVRIVFRRTHVQASTNLVRRSAQKALAASELLKEARVRGDEMEEQLENAKRAVKRLTLQLEQRDTQV